MHEGVDFTPGAGSPIQAIADGVVRIATNSGGAYGVTVVIDHVIDGQLVSSRYAHMQYGSLQVAVGQHVTVGTVIGRTGNTGRSFGAHTHFEILHERHDGDRPDPVAARARRRLTPIQRRGSALVFSSSCPRAGDTPR